MRGATRPNIQRLRRCSTDLKRWLDREKGYKGKPAWSREVGAHGYLHQHGLVGDYGVLDFKKLNHWMIAHGYYVLIDGRKVPWRTRYRWLKSREHGAGYMAKYIVKGAETKWPRYTRIRYTPIPKDKFVPDEAFALVRDVSLIRADEPAPNLSKDMLAPVYLPPASVPLPALTDEAKRQRFTRKLAGDAEQIEIRHRNTEANWRIINYIFLFSSLSLSNKDIRSVSFIGQGAVS